MTTATIIFIVVFWALPTWVCVAQGKQRNRNGWAWGLLLGWLGVLMIFLLPSRTPAPGKLVALPPPREPGELDSWKQYHR